MRRPHVAIETYVLFTLICVLMFVYYARQAP